MVIITSLEMNIFFSLQYVSAKLLVLSGFPSESAKRSEVIPIGDRHSSCEVLYSHKFDYFDGFGGLIDDEIIVCPGWNGISLFITCTVLSKQNPRFRILLDNRINAASVVVYKTVSKFILSLGSPKIILMCNIIIFNILRLISKF